MDSHACHFKWQVILVKHVWIRLRCTSLIVSVYQSLYWIKYTLLIYFRALLDIAEVLGSCYQMPPGKAAFLMTMARMWAWLPTSVSESTSLFPTIIISFWDTGGSPSDPHDFQAVTQENQHKILFNFTSETTVYGTTEVSSHWLRHATSIENLPWQAHHKMQDCLENKI